MWRSKREYFSFTACVPLLILSIFTHQLDFDNYAISLFSAYASLVYVTLGGWIVDCLLGNCTAIAGALLMTLGHVVRALIQPTFSLYLALAIIICGYGLFQPNISCLVWRASTTRTIIDGGFSPVCCGQHWFYRSSIACGPHQW